MESIQRAEDRLSGIEWLIHGDSASRTRSYEALYPLPAAQVLANLKTAISSHKLLGPFVSSTGMGEELLTGSVVGPSYEAKLYSPIDTTVLPMAQATAWGDVIDLPEGGSQVRLQIRPSAGGIWVWLVGVLIGVATMLFGVLQFAVHQEWKSFLIVAGVALVFLVVPPLLLWWAIAEGRANERQLLERIDGSILQNTGS